MSSRVSASPARTDAGDASPLRLLVVTVAGQSYGLCLESVERVLRAAAVTPLAGAPEIALGVLDLAGRLVAVLDLRRRLAGVAKPLHPADMFVLARCRKRDVALVVDAVEGVVTRAASSVTPRGDVLPGSGYVHGLVREDDGLLLIHDLDQLLALGEEADIERARSGAR